MSELPANIHQLLGTLIAKIEALESRMDRSDHSQCMREKQRDEVIKQIYKDVEELKTFMMENKGGRKMLLLLLTAAGGTGAVLVELVQRLLVK